MNVTNVARRTVRSVRKGVARSLAALLLTAPLHTKAQTNIDRYVLNKGTETYTELSAARTVVATATGTSGATALDDVYYRVNFPSGFTFNYGGVAQTAINVNSNGFAGFGSVAWTSNTTSPLSATPGGGTTSGILSILGADLMAIYVSGATAGDISWELTGTGTDQVFILQWKNFRQYSSSTIANHALNFQVQLYAATHGTMPNAVRFAYGSCTIGSATISSAQVGIRGGSTTWSSSVNNLQIGNIPAGTTCSWMDAVTGNSESSAMLFSSANTSVNIPAGLTYTWTPQTTVAPVRTFTAVTNLGQTGATVNWTAPAGATRYSVQYRIPGTCGWTDFTGNPVTGNSAALTGLQSNTTYQVRVQAAGAADQAIWSHIPNTAGTGSGYTTTGTFTTQYTDLQAQQLQAPVTNAFNCFAVPQRVAIRLKNAGTSAIDFAANPATVSAAVSGPNPVTFTPVIVNTGTLAAGGTLDVDVAAAYNMTAGGNYIFNAFVKMATSDAYPANDTMTATTRVNSIAAVLPESIDFTGFTGANLNTVFPNWREASGATVPAGTTSDWVSSSAIAGSGVTARVNLYTNTKKEWIIGPKVQVTNRTRVRYKIAITAYNSSNVHAVGMQGTDDKVMLKVSADCGATWTTVTTFDASNTASVTNALVQQISDLSAFAGQEVIVAFQATDGPIDDAPDYDFHLDDIFIEETPACDAPAAATSSDVAINTARISWTASVNNPGSYEIYYATTAAPAPADTTTPQVTGIAGLTYNFTGLAPATTYYVWVRSRCDVNMTSSWIQMPVSFTTQCQPPALLSTVPATRCGNGTVDLSATTEPGAVLSWYAAQTGGAALATGSVFTTPVLSSSTDYWVSAMNTSTTGLVGPAAYNTLSTTSADVQNSTATGLKFDVNNQGGVLINSVDIYPTATIGSSFTIVVRSGSASGTIVATYSGTTTVRGTLSAPVVQTVPVNFRLPAGTSYYMVFSVNNASVYRNSASNIPFPYTAANNAVAITAPTTSGYYYYFYNWSVSAICESARTLVKATVNAAPAFSVSNNMTGCNNGPSTLTVTSDVNAYDTYTWSPATNLYTDAAATIPYAAGAGAATVYYKSATTGNATVSATALNTPDGCTATSSVTIQTLPAQADITAVPESVCISGNSILTLPASLSGLPANMIQWQFSADGSNYMDISGATGTSYTTPVLTATSYYRALVKNSVNAVCLTVTKQINVNNPATPVTTDGTHCGPGSVTLAAAAMQGDSLQWYAAATGGNPIATGSTYTTPELNVTTNYWVAAARVGSPAVQALGAGASASSSSYVNPFYHLWGGRKAQYLIRASELQAAGMSAGPINSLGFDFTATGTSYAGFAISMKNTTTTALTTTMESGLTGVYAVSSVTPVTGVNTYSFTTPFTWDGTSNLLVQVCWSNNNGGGSSPTIKYDAVGFAATAAERADNNTPAAMCGITTVYENQNNRPRMLLGYTGMCVGSRTQVTAAITTPPSMQVSAVPAAVCAGGSSTLHADAANTGYTYYWRPLNQAGNNLAVTPSATTKYYVEATDNSGGPGSGCVNRDSVEVAVFAYPSALVVTPAAPQTICLGTQVPLTVNSVMYGNVFGEMFEASAPATFTVTGTGVTSAQSVTYYRQGSASRRLSHTTNADGAYAMTSDVRLGGQTGSALSFWHICATEGTATNNYDYGEVQYSTDGGTTWATFPVAAYQGSGSVIGTTGVAFNRSSYPDWNATFTSATSTPGTGPATSLWKKETINLDAYAGSNNFRIRFRLKSDGSTNYYGWLIDSVVISAPIQLRYTWSATPMANSGIPGSAVNPDSATANLNVLPVAPGTYTYTATVMNGPGCASTGTSAPVEVVQGPVVMITAAGPTALCNGASVLLKATQGPGYTYQWFNNGTPVASPVGNFPTYTATAAGSYTVRVTTGDCSGISAPLIVTAIAPPAPVVNISGPASFCAGRDSAVLSATPQGPGYTYRWMKDGQALNNATGATYTVRTGTGNYSVVVTQSGVCSGTSAETHVTVRPAPDPVISVNGNVLMTANTYNSYQWYLDGVAIPGANAYIYSALQSGVYSVCASLTDCNGCSAPKTLSVSVPSVSVEAIRIYPNPAQDLVTVDAPVPVNISVRSADGKEVLFLENARIINVGALADGVYMIRVTDAQNSLIKTDRLVKQTK